MTGIYTYSGTTRYQEEFRELSRQLGLPLACYDERSVFLEHLTRRSGADEILVRIYGRVPHTPVNLIRVDIIPGSDIESSKGRYWTFVPIAHEGEVRTRVGEEVKTSNRSLVKDRPISWSLDHALKEGDSVSVLVRWYGNAPDLFDMSFSCLVNKGRP